MCTVSFVDRFAHKENKNGKSEMALMRKEVKRQPEKTYTKAVLQ